MKIVKHAFLVILLMSALMSCNKSDSSNDGSPTAVTNSWTYTNSGITLDLVFGNNTYSLLEAGVQVENGTYSIQGSTITFVVGNSYTCTAYAKTYKYSFVVTSTKLTLTKVTDDCIFRQVGYTTGSYTKK